VDVRELEAYGKIGAWVLFIISVITGYGWTVKQNSNRLARLEGKVFPDTPDLKLLTVRHYREMQGECEDRHSAQLAHIKEDVADIKGELRDVGGKVDGLCIIIERLSTQLDERTGRR
jgi:hypothetical protein